MKACVQSEELARQLGALPDVPGVYAFKNVHGETIYIGKAVSLRGRVRSYWNETAWHERPKLAVMMPKVASIDVILTNSEKEALLLEANLVREHMPRYNVALKDDKRYPWLAITYDVAFPRLIMVRDPIRFKKQNPKARVFGPYVETGAMWETVKVLRKVFPMRQRKKPLFKDRPCMNYYIGLCLGPCQNLVEAEPYDRMVRQVEMFLAGWQTEVIEQMKAEMESAAERLEFEQAAKIRDRLAALTTVIEKQQVFFDNPKINQDVIAEAHTNRLISVCLMKVREGKLISSEPVSLPLVERTGWEEAFQSFVDQYYTSCEDIMIPHEVLLQHELEDSNALLEFFNSKASYTVRMNIPRRGGKFNLIEMAQKNARLALEQELTVERESDSKADRIMSTLKNELGMAQVPSRIECFDVSNIQGTDNVASLVVFENARPKKSDYRHFKVRAVEGAPNDFASMKEVVHRRYKKLQQDGKPLPDLIIVDGGKGQLSAAMEALAELKLNDIDIIGLAKRKEEIYRPGRSEPVLLPRHCEALHLLQRVRDEAHRFAVTFHRKLRSKRSLVSNLDLLKGVGKARRKTLLDHFGSFDKIKEATIEQLESVPGISRSLAHSIYSSLHDEKMIASSSITN